ncbi:MAG TPA: thiamine-binding protein [Candidatus Wunengus sp. YC60]
MIAEISVIPIGEGIDLASYVAKVVKIIDESGLAVGILRSGHL